MEIQFFAPTRGTFYRFEAQPAEHDAIDAEHVFRITATGWVSTWFVDDIYLGYSSERRLTDFYGLTNIPKTRTSITPRTFTISTTPRPCAADGNTCTHPNGVVGCAAVTTASHHGQE